MPARPSRSTGTRATVILLAAVAVVVAALSALLAQSGATNRTPTAVGLLGSATRDSSTASVALRRADGSSADRRTGTVQASASGVHWDAQSHLLAVLAGTALTLVMAGRVAPSGVRSRQCPSGDRGARHDRGPPGRAVCFA